MVILFTVSSLAFSAAGEETGQVQTAIKKNIQSYVYVVSENGNRDGII